jgi:hypothetical protein
VEEETMAPAKQKKLQSGVGRAKKKSPTKKRGRPKKKTVIEEKPVLENIGTDTAKFHEMNITAKEKKNKNRKISVQKHIQRTEEEKASDRDWKRNAIYMEEYLQVVNIENPRVIYNLSEENTMVIMEPQIHAITQKTPKHVANFLRGLNEYFKYETNAADFKEFLNF